MAYFWKDLFIFLLIDGDRKAFHENAEWTKRKNHEKVEKLRKENNELRFRLKDLLAVSGSLFQNRQSTGDILLNEYQKFMWYPLFVR